ncbi:acetyl-CoA carboxylase biotin carboxyl carrier protein [Sporosarcina sp. HYO08]|uniref:acetyl-CoA carboxylase biotin carboxyl carrier protein n=1 Tax=Sporosarcina sp. HYO08 TaxID=1759557 RepID=UPI00079875CF|nr:acetyl-CoA carboxylase biotin carboxyl carrier protein [Sporosarcina sp. HYO08]KXH87482.1 acetyl-CoA carboxylase biotin carboxyl carrier protein subunit [Sporosarcina sp. HYO08]
MLKIQEIREIIKLIDQSSIEKFSFESEGTKIKLEKNSGKQATAIIQETVAAPIVQREVVAAPQPQVQAVQEEVPVQAPVETAANDASLHKITSPMVGTFYASSSPDTPPYVQKGDKVQADSVVCIVEAMKLFNEIEAEISGEIVEVLVNDGQLVEYGQPLFLVKAN